MQSSSPGRVARIVPWSVFFSSVCCSLAERCSVRFQRKACCARALPWTVGLSGWSSCIESIEATNVCARVQVYPRKWATLHRGISSTFESSGIQSGRGGEGLLQTRPSRVGRDQLPGTALDGGCGPGVCCRGVYWDEHPAFPQESAGCGRV